MGGSGGRIFFQLSTRQNFIDEISRGEVESVEKEIITYVRLLVFIRAGEVKPVAAHFLRCLLFLPTFLLLGEGKSNLQNSDKTCKKTESRQQARLGPGGYSEDPGSCGPVLWRQR